MRLHHPWSSGTQKSETTIHHEFAETHCETHVVNVCWEFKYTPDSVLGEWSKHKILGKTVVLNIIK